MYLIIPACWKCWKLLEMTSNMNKINYLETNNQ
jgi:hypothetical protein